jgi:8-oxo-dGTP pyrophosphatase MutT (NUDIX family)
MTPVRKAVAYIVHRERLLVFDHTESPEAGTQVPAGTLEAGETPHEAVLREAFEESGLRGLAVRAYLGSWVEDASSHGTSRPVERHFFHLTFSDGEAELPETWRHYEMTPSEGPARPIPFDFRWVSLHDVPDLAGDLGVLLDDLRAHIERGA